MLTRGDRRGLGVGAMVCVAMVVAFAPAQAQEGAQGELDARASFPQPSADYGPEDVVRIQVEALANNDEPFADAGIEITFAFASPNNKRATGPLGRFIPLLKNPLYSPMLDHTAAEYGPLEVSGNEAQQLVILTSAEGERAGYLFTLSRQQGGEFAGVWMTDAVARVQLPDPGDLSGRAAPGAKPG